MIMMVAYVGGHHFFVYPKGGHHFFSFDKGGSCVFVRCFAGSYRPPSSRNNERSLSDPVDAIVIELTTSKLKVTNYKISYGYNTNIDDSGSVDAPNFDIVVKNDLGYCICLYFFSFTIGWPLFLMDEWTTSWLVTHQ